MLALLESSVFTLFGLVVVVVVVLVVEVAGRVSDSLAVG